MIEPEDVIDIRDPEINVEEIMDCIRQRIRARQKQAESQGLDYLALAGEEGLADGGGTSSELYADLHQLRHSTDSLRVTPLLTDWRIPLINGLINRLKAMLHALVLMYVNMLAGRQIAINRSISQALFKLAGARQADAGRLEALEKEVAALREQLAQLRENQSS